MRDLEGQEDDALVALVREGEIDAFTEIVRRYKGVVTGLIQRLIGDPHRALDLSQEVFLRVHTHLPRYRPQRTFRAWILTIATNAARDEVRRRPSAPILYLNPSRFGAPPAEEGARERVASQWAAPPPEEELARRELQKAVRRAIASLPRTHRLPLMLRDIDGLSYEEIVQVTGWNLGTVKSRVHRARMAFKDAFERMRGDRFEEAANDH